MTIITLDLGYMRCQQLAQAYQPLAVSICVDVLNVQDELAQSWNEILTAQAREPHQLHGWY